MEAATPPVPGLPEVFQAAITVAAPIVLGNIPTGLRRIVPITGGQFHGPRLSGIVLPGGADWQVIAADGTTRLEARYTLREADGTLISVVNCGIRRGPPALMRRLAAGEAVDPALIYFRTAPVFEVAAGPHAWLCDSLFVATAHRQPDCVVLRVFEVA